MNWLITHMVSPVEQALQCNDCHGEEGRLDWRALGYNGDPIEWGGRFKITPASDQRDSIQGIDEKCKKLD